MAQQTKNCLLLTHSPLNRLYPPVRIHVLSTTCNVISFNDQGQLYQLTCAERRDLSNHTRNHLTLHQKFPRKSYSTTHLPFRLSNFKILNLSQEFSHGNEGCLMPKKRKKSIRPLPEVPEAKTSLFVYLWLAVDMSFQTYWQGKQTNKQFTLSRRNNHVINLPSTEKGHIMTCIVAR